MGITVSYPAAKGGHLFGTNHAADAMRDVTVQLMRRPIADYQTCRRISRNLVVELRYQSLECQRNQSRFRDGRMRIRLEHGDGVNAALIASKNVNKLVAKEPLLVSIPVVTSQVIAALYFPMVRIPSIRIERRLRPVDLSHQRMPS